MNASAHLAIPQAAATGDSLHPEDVRRIVRNCNHTLGSLIRILEEIQSACGYLPEEAIRTVAAETGFPLVDVYGVATFYGSFSMKPKGRHTVCVCLGTACHVRGAAAIVDEFTRQLGVGPGETTPDGEFTLETVNCLGACALGPIVVADGRYFAKVTAAAVSQILKETARHAEEDQPLEIPAPVAVSG